MKDAFVCDFAIVISAIDAILGSLLAVLHRDLTTAKYAKHAKKTSAPRAAFFRVFGVFRGCSSNLQHAPQNCSYAPYG
jgi:hypothetical protein